MPYKDCERKEIVMEIVRRQAYRILKVGPACSRLLSKLLSFTLHIKTYNICDGTNLKGNTLWKQLEKTKLCGGNRTWQSMKEQFRKVQQY